MAKELLNDRARVLLKSLVERYIRDGQPVGSRTLSREHELSPATIRNAMSDLEELGLVTSPHTSAGRIPTVQGYRLFVDQLIVVQRIEQIELALKLELQSTHTQKGMIEAASSMLAEMTNMAGIVSLPRAEYQQIRTIEFLPLSGKQVLAIVVVNDQEVHNHVIETSRVYSRDELQVVSNYLSQSFVGRSLSEARQQLLNQIQTARSELDQMLDAVVDVATKTFADEDEPADNAVVSGHTQLMNFADLGEIDKLRGLFQAFDQKTEILEIFDRCVQAEGVGIYIGEESGYLPLGDCSVVSSPYEVDGQIIGALGVVGPTRMEYEKVIPIVDATARILGAALSSSDDNESN